MYILFQSSVCGENDRVVCVIPERLSDAGFNKLGSLLRVNEIGLICAILNGRLDTSMLKSPCGKYFCYLFSKCAQLIDSNSTMHCVIGTYERFTYIVVVDWLLCLTVTRTKDIGRL